MNNKIRKLQLGDYFLWNNLSREDKVKRNKQIAKLYLDKGPSILNYYNALKAYFGGFNPKNPYLLTGEPVILPGRATPQLILLSAKLMETINKYWKNLGKLKIRLGGNGKYASGILTKPGTAPTTFNGQNINYITSPKGGNVTHKFYTDQGSEYILTKDGFARRVKSSHANTGGTDAGLHEWNKGATRFLDSDELGWSYQAWTDRTKPLGFSEKDGIISLVTKDNGKWRYVMRSELRPNAIKNGTIKDGIILSAYTTEPKIGKWMLEYGTNPTGEINWFHPGSQVAFIEGLKQGGLIKSANARKWKHLQGGIIGSKVNNWFKSDLGKVVTNGVSLLYTGLLLNANLTKLNDLLQEWKKNYLKSIEPEDFSVLVNQEEELLKQANPDYNTSPLVKLHKQYLLLTQALNRAKEKAGMDADQYIQLYMLAQQNNSSSGDIFSSMLKTFLG